MSAGNTKDPATGSTVARHHDGVEPSVSRLIWQRLEAVNAVTYFSDECRDAYKRLGLRGFWMGYFAGRAAPMGAVSADVVEAAFYNFHPAMVQRAIPDAWTFATPAATVSTRADAAAGAVRRLAPESGEIGVELSALLRRAVAHGDTTDRPLFAANQAIAATGDPVADVWQAATTLREHRGDSHVQLLRDAGLDGLAAHVLFAATEGVPADVLRDNRGWSPGDWADATERCRARNLLDADGHPTTAGNDLRRRIELRTDELAAQPYATLDDHEIDRLIALATRIAEPITASGTVPFPNPIGLPRPDPPA